MHFVVGTAFSVVGVWTNQKGLMYECVCGLHKWLTKFEYKMKWKMMLIAMSVLLHFFQSGELRLWSMEAEHAFRRASGSAIYARYFISIDPHS